VRSLGGPDPDDVDAFVEDVRTQWAVEMGLIRIGETINRIPDSILERFPDQPWRQIVGMRNSRPISTTISTRVGSGGP